MSLVTMELRFAKFMLPIARFFKAFTPLVDLIIRLYIAQIFFSSGLTKLASWSTTKTLFTYVYHVPLISPVTAAYLGTAAELVLPVLLVLGLGTRLMLFAFFVYNLVAAISYPFLWTAQGAVGLHQHITWGLLLAVLVVGGPGKWSLDYLFYSRHMRRMEIDKLYHDQHEHKA